MREEDFLKMYRYEPDTGILYGIKGKPVIDKDGRGYLILSSVTNKSRVRMLAHRFAYLYMTGELPKEVDHINNKILDNRWCNLRAATRSENTRNSKLSKRNTSGIKGVSWHKQREKWNVRISVDGVYKSFGLYEDIELAELVAQEARDKYHGAFANHG